MRLVPGRVKPAETKRAPAADPTIPADSSSSATTQTAIEPPLLGPTFLPTGEDGADRAPRLRPKPQHVAEGEPNEAIIARERIAIDDFAWEPSIGAIEARRSIKRFVELFNRKEFDQAIAAAEDGRYTVDCQEWGTIRWQTKDVVIDLAELRDPHYLDGVIDDIVKIGFARDDQITRVGRGIVDRSNEYVCSVPRLVLDIGAGKKVDITHPGATNTTSGEVLDPVAMKLIATVRDSRAGQRILREQALLLAEERLIHINQQQNGHALISPTYARFAKEEGRPFVSREKPGDELFDALMDVRRSPKTMEQEVIALLFDAGLPFDELASSLERKHEEERKPFFAWLRRGV